MFVKNHIFQCDHAGYNFGCFVLQINAFRLHFGKVSNWRWHNCAYIYYIYTYIFIYMNHIYRVASTFSQHQVIVFELFKMYESVMCE